MTIVEIEDTLPNGLHDADIQNIFLDFINKKARFGLNVCIGNPDSPNEDEREGTRPGVLTISGLFLFIIKPDENYLISRKYEILEAQAIKLEDFPIKIKKSIPASAFINVIYTNFTPIYIAAENAEFERTQ